MENLVVNSFCVPETPQEEVAYKKLGKTMFDLYKRLDKVRNNGGGKEVKKRQEKEICAEIVNRNQRLAINIAYQIKKCFRDRAIDLEDLIQEGKIGLLIGTERFDYKQGNKYSSYVSFWVRQSITKFVIESSGIIIRPSHMHGNVKNLADAEKTLRARHGHNGFDDNDLANHLGWKIEKVQAVKDARRLGQEMFSLDDDAHGDTREGASISFLDKVAATNSDGEETIVESEVFKKQLVAEVTKVLFKCGLDERKQDIINRRFAREHTLEQVGDAYGLTRERIRQIQEDALGRLRKEKHLKKLRQIDPDAFSKEVVVEENEKIFPQRREEILKNFSEFVKHLESLDLEALSPRAVLIKVAEFFGFTSRRIVGTRQNSALHLTRSIIAYIINRHKQMECKEIGTLLGHRSYNTTYAWLKEGEKIFKKNKKPRK